MILTALPLPMDGIDIDPEFIIYAIVVVLWIVVSIYKSLNKGAQRIRKASMERKAASRPTPQTARPMAPQSVRQPPRPAASPAQTAAPQPQRRRDMMSDLESILRDQLGLDVGPKATPASPPLAAAPVQSATPARPAAPARPATPARPAAPRPAASRPAARPSPAHRAPAPVRREVTVPQFEEPIVVAPTAQETQAAAFAAAGSGARQDLTVGQVSAQNLHAFDIAGPGARQDLTVGHVSDQNLHAFDIEAAGRRGPNRWTQSLRSSTIRQAVVHREILGPCKAMR